jgi:hypothetical protein
VTARTPGAAAEIYYYNTTSESWVFHPDGGVVTGDGMGVQFTTTHFTIYSISVLTRLCAFGAQRFVDTYSQTGNPDMALLTMKYSVIDTSDIFINKYKNYDDNVYRVVGADILADGYINGIEFSVETHVYPSGDTTYTGSEFKYIYYWDTLNSIFVDGNVEESQYIISIITQLVTKEYNPVPDIYSSPDDDAANVAVTDHVKLVFTEKMDKASVESAFSISPVVAGTFTWPSDDMVEWIPSADLDANTTYTVTVADSAISVDDYNLEAPYVFSFKTKDNDGPTPGAGGYSFTHVSGTAISLNWTAASDSLTPQEDLYYKVVSSPNADIGTVGDAETNGTVAQAWLPNVTSAQVQASSYSQNTYYAVLVRDEAGNITTYGQKVAPIVETAGLPANGTYYNSTTGWSLAINGNTYTYTNDPETYIYLCSYDLNNVTMNFLDSFDIDFAWMFTDSSTYILEGTLAATTGNQLNDNQLHCCPIDLWV